MLLLLLVSNQVIIPKMEMFDANQELISSEPIKKIHSNYSTNKDVILCKHCKRTATNGIRCLGMCVADNDY